MMMNNPNVMGPSVVPSTGANPVPPQAQPPQAAAVAQMMPAGLNPAMNIQARQSQNDDILTRCLAHTQRLRESLQGLLNTTKQAANIENEDQASLSSTTANPSTNTVIRNNIDRKLCDMSSSLDQLYSLIDQYDFKVLQSQQTLVNHYNELSYEKQGTLLDEWTSDTRWADKLLEIFPFVQPSLMFYRRSNQRNLNLNARSRHDGPSSHALDRIIGQFEASVSQQQQQTAPKDYQIHVNRLSDHLNIIEISLPRSGLFICLYVRHCTVEHVIVKPLNEKKLFTNQTYSKSSTNYRALELIAGHIRAAAVYFAQASNSDQNLGKLLLYIIKYQTSHVQKCSNCQKHLLNGLQPTWRDFKTYECFHEECLN